MRTIQLLILLICEEIERVWPDGGGIGSFEGYAWLEAVAGITDMDDVRWQMITESWLEDDTTPPTFEFICEQKGFDPDESEDRELATFLADESAVREFLWSLVERYHACSVTWEDAPAAEQNYHITGHNSGYRWIDDLTGRQSGLFATYQEARLDRIATFAQA